MKKVISLFVCLFAIVSFSTAQKFKPSPIFLKGEKEINVVFVYSEGITFDGDSKQEYYKDKGESWVAEWEGKRRTTNSSSYIKDVNGELEGLNINIGEYSNANYTMIVDVVDCDFGAYAGPLSVPAKLKCTIRFVKTGTTETLTSIALKISQNSYSVIATPIDFDRMHLAFGEMGEKVGEILYKILKK
ncbi:hypothetical protein LJC11_00480 [Bacteroidales bacterium OttesenSCG-928-I21]|nr:hypothetical protein [Bacteroidales bacterium OttesenSCG-928-I21]